MQAWSRRADVAPFETKDGSQIRELIHPAIHGPGAQSLAEATVPPGGSTIRHWHARTEEIYHVTSGAGELSVGEEVMALRAGDTVRIPPGTQHGLRNPGPAPLVVLCACSPPYSHDDTFLVE